MNSKEPRLVRGLGGNGLFQPQGFNPGAASYAMPVPIPVDVAVAEDRGSPLPDAPNRETPERGGRFPAGVGRKVIGPS
jgi:hypothetical protein